MTGGRPTTTWGRGNPDLAAVAGTALLAGASVLLPVVRESPLRAVLGLALATVLPGYALVAALFPGESDDPDPPDDDPELDGSGGRDGSRDGETPGPTPDRGPDGPVERVALGAGLGILVSMALGLTVTAVLGFGAAPVVGGLAAITLAGCGVAAVRRRRGPTGPAGDAVPVGRWLLAARAWPGGRSRRGIALDVGIALTVVVALAGVGYLLAAPKPAAGYTELYLLADDTAGPDAGRYPTALSPGERGSVVVGVESHHHGPREYAVVVVLQRVGGANASGNGTADAATVRAERTVATHRVRLTRGERWTVEETVTPGDPGRYRLVVGLYRGDPEGEPVHRVHLWIDVTKPADGTAGAANETDGPRDGTRVTAGECPTSVGRAVRSRRGGRP